jgi:hypothetical protein
MTEPKIPHLHEVVRGGRERARAGALGCAETAAAVGLDEFQEPRLSRRHLRRGTDRLGHREHHPARNFQYLPRSWPTARHLIEDVPATHAVMDSLAKTGNSMKAVTDKLLEEGLQQFQTAFDALLQATGKASAQSAVSAA